MEDTGGFSIMKKIRDMHGIVTHRINDLGEVRDLSSIVLKRFN